MTYTELKKSYVFQTLDGGAKVVLCDFATLRMMDCSTMTVGAIQALMEREDVIFYKGVANEQA
jgi:hypothetical protein